MERRRYYQILTAITFAVASVTTGCGGGITKPPKPPENPISESGPQCISGEDCGTERSLGDENDKPNQSDELERYREIFATSLFQ